MNSGEADSDGEQLEAQPDERSTLEEIAGSEGLPAGLTAEIVDETLDASEEPTPIAGPSPTTCGKQYERDAKLYPERCQLGPDHKIAGHDDADHYHGNIGWWRSR